MKKTFSGLNKIRKPLTDYNAKTAVLHTFLLFSAGLATGVIIKFFDIYTTNVGNIFSQMSVWIFICTLISVLSYTPKRAGINVFVYCVGMLLTYYVTAHLTESVYSMTFVYGWFVFSLFSPALGFAVWYARGTHLLSKLLGGGVILVILLLAVVLFGRVRLADVIIAISEAIFLFGCKKRKNK